MIKMTKSSLFKSDVGIPSSLIRSDCYFLDDAVWRDLRLVADLGNEVWLFNGVYLLSRYYEFMTS
jgi:hypothetical protein